MASTLLPPSTLSEREVARLVLDSLRRQALKAAAACLGLRDHIQQLTARRVVTRQIHAPIVTEGVAAGVLGVIVVGWLVGAYILDNTLLRASGDYLLTLVGFSESQAYVGVYILALGVLLLDVAWGVLVAKAFESTSSVLVRAGAIGMGAGWPIAIALFTKAAFEANTPLEGVVVPGFESQKAAAVLVALLTHGSLVAGGGIILRGLKNLAWLLPDRRNERLLIALRAQYHSGLAEFEALRIRYREAATEFNRLFPEHTVAIDELEDTRKRLTEGGEKTAEHE